MRNAAVLLEYCSSAPAQSSATFALVWACFSVLAVNEKKARFGNSGAIYKDYDHPLRFPLIYSEASNNGF